MPSGTLERAVVRRCASAEVPRVAPPHPRTSAPQHFRAPWSRRGGGAQRRASAEVPERTPHLRTPALPHSTGPDAGPARRAARRLRSLSTPFHAREPAPFALRGCVMSRTCVRLLAAFVFSLTAASPRIYARLVDGIDFRRGRRLGRRRHSRRRRCRQERRTGETFTTVSSDEGVFTVPASSPEATASPFPCKASRPRPEQRGRERGRARQRPRHARPRRPDRAVTVQANSELVQTQTATVATVLDTRQVASLPLSSRNAADFVVFLPGVTTPAATETRLSTACRRAPST